MGGHGDIAGEFRDVDSAEPERLAGFLAALAADPGFARVKRRSLDLLELGPGDRALDLGCGLGAEVRAMAARVAPGGTATGLDASEALLARAREGAPEGASFVPGDLHALPLPDGAVDAVRVERTLQHVADPALALAEMVRVTAPGGRVVVAEPDWGTFTADLGPPEVSRLVCARRAAAIRNPAVGRHAPRLLRDLGLGEVTVEPVAVHIDDPALVEPAYELRAEAARAAAEGALDPETAAAWTAEVDARLAGPGGLLTILVMVVTAGRVFPSRTCGVERGGR